MRTPPVTLVPASAHPSLFEAALGRFLELVVLSVEGIRARWLTRARG
jgi:hypothetical protein